MSLNFNRADRYIELNLLECGREKCIPNKKLTFVSKTYYILHYVLSGQGTLEMNGVTYKIKKGSAFLIPPPLVPRYYPDPLDPWTYVWIGFGGINAEQYMELANLTIKDPIIHDDSEQTIRYLMEKLHESFLDGGYLGMNCLGICYQVVSNLIKIGHRVEDEISQPKRHVNAAKDYILNNFQFNITISDIASNAGVTTNYLAYIFKQVTGVSPKQFLTSTRITRACNLLRVDAYPIKEIAKLVGYSNQLHFSSSFKKAVGVSPLQYRQKECDE